MDEVHFDREKFCLYLVTQLQEMLGSGNEQGLERGADDEGFAKGMGTSLEGASLPALRSSRRTIAKYSMSRFLV